MKFWQKIFVSSLLLFIVVFDIGSYILVSNSNKFNLQREKDSSLREQTLIASTLQNIVLSADLFNNAGLIDNNRLSSIFKTYADYYKNQGVTLALYQNSHLIYISNPKLLKYTYTKINQNQVRIQDKRILDKRYLIISSVMPSLSKLDLVYLRDISGIDMIRQKVIRVFIYVSGVVSIGVCIIFYFLLKKLTRPITELNLITSKIACGDFHQRVKIFSKDELGELATTFNLMADSVEDKIIQLIDSVESKQRFIDNLAHEMRTPLTSIMGYARFIQRAKSTEHDRILAAGHLYDSAERLQKLSVKLLELIFYRKTEIEFKQVDTKKLFSALEGMMQPSLRERNLKLDTTSELDFLVGDETLLFLFLTNLVENAARASEAHDVIHVRAFNSNSPIIEVIDQGKGIQSSDIEKVTEPFFRVDANRSRLFGGVGLGLSLCKEIADLHHAELQIESKIGAGTTVRLKFNNSITTLK